MVDKQIIIDVCPYQGECSVSGCKRNDDGCFVRQLYKERDRAENRIVELNKTIQAKEQECEELKKGYAELTDIVAPYMDDFTGYNEELGGFDIVLCVKQLMEQLDQLKAENETLKQYKTSKQASYESMQREWNNAVNENRGLKAENEELKEKINSLLCSKNCYKYKQAEQYKQTLAEIKEIAEETINSSDCYKRMYGGMCARPILQKISEVENG